MWRTLPHALIQATSGYRPRRGVVGPGTGYLGEPRSGRGLAVPSILCIKICTEGCVCQWHAQRVHVQCDLNLGKRAADLCELCTQLRQMVGCAVSPLVHTRGAAAHQPSEPAAQPLRERSPDSARKAVSAIPHRRDLSVRSQLRFANAPAVVCRAPAHCRKLARSFGSVSVMCRA